MADPKKQEPLDWTIRIEPDQIQAYSEREAAESREVLESSIYTLGREILNTFDSLREGHGEILASGVVTEVVRDGDDWCFLVKPGDRTLVSRGLVGVGTLLRFPLNEAINPPKDQ